MFLFVWCVCSIARNSAATISVEMANQLWFRHPARCWALGDIKQLHGTTAEVVDVLSREVCSWQRTHSLSRPIVESFSTPVSQTRTVQLADTHPGDASHHVDTEDIAKMNNMHEGPLLALL